MSCFGLLVATAAFVAGLIAALYWYKASTFAVHPFYGATEPGDAVLSQMLQQAATIQTVGESGRLNKHAALWSAASVALSGLSALVSGAGVCL